MSARRRLTEIDIGAVRVRHGDGEDVIELGESKSVFFVLKVDEAEELGKFLLERVSAIRAGITGPPEPKRVPPPPPPRATPRKAGA